MEPPTKERVHVDVSGIFWEFCKSAAHADSMDEFVIQDVYERMNEAVCSQRKLALAPSPPLRKFGPSLVRHLPPGCAWNAEESIYVFDGIDELFYGVREIIDPHAPAHESVLETCIKRMLNRVDTNVLADALTLNLRLPSGTE